MRAKAETSDATSFNAKSTAKSAVKPAVNHAAKSVDRESAVAPVVAVLLILAVLMTIISLYSAIYVPALKEQSEIEHLAGVEDTFLLFSSDIESAILTKSEGTVTRNVELGGGSVVLSPLKSGGIMEVKDDTPTWLCQIYKSNERIPENLMSQSSLVNFSYESVGNFWMDNGYLWDYGIVSLKTPYSSLTPIQYTTYDAAAEDIKKNGGIFKSFYDMDYSSTVYFVKDLGTGDLTGEVWEICKDITITGVTFKNGAEDYISGSGHATLKMDAKMEYRTANATELVFYINPDLFSPGTDNEILNSTGSVLTESIGLKLNEFKSKNFKNAKNYNYDKENHHFEVAFDPAIPVRLTVRNLILTISV